MASDGGTPLRVGQLVRHGQCFVEGAAPDRQLDAEHLQRPLVPAHGVRAIRTVPSPASAVLSGPSYEPRIKWICASVSNTAPVVSPNFTALRTSSARFRICSARSRSPTCTWIWPSVASREASPFLSERLVQPDASFPSARRRRPMPHQRDVCLVVNDSREHIVC